MGYMLSIRTNRIYAEDRTEQRVLDNTNFVILFMFVHSLNLI